MTPKRFFYIGICILIALCITFAVYRATAETTDDCGYTGDGFGDTNICQQNIYHRLGVLIQEQNRTNKLLAAEICTHNYGSLDFYSADVFTQNSTGLLGNSHKMYYITFHQCMSQVLEDTK